MPLHLLLFYFSYFSIAFSESAVSPGQNAFQGVLATAQQRRLEDQRIIESAPVLCNLKTNHKNKTETVLSQLMANTDTSEPDDQFFDMLVKSQVKMNIDLTICV